MMIPKKNMTKVRNVIFTNFTPNTRVLFQNKEEKKNRMSLFSVKLMSPESILKKQVYHIY